MAEKSKIYGYLEDKANIVIGIGGYNNIQSLLCLKKQKLEMIHLSDRIINDLLEFELNLVPEDGQEFYLYNKKYDLYLGIHKGIATLTEKLTIFTIHLSTVDKIPRSKLLAGNLYCLKVVDEIVKWNVQEFAPADLICFQPTTWYQRDLIKEEESEEGESVRNSVEKKNGLALLIASLKQKNFLGYTNESKALEDINQKMIYCENSKCDKCLGYCANANHICVLKNDKFSCLPPSQEFLTQTTSQGNNTLSVLITIFIIILIIIILAYGIIKNKSF